MLDKSNLAGFWLCENESGRVITSGLIIHIHIVFNIVPLECGVVNVESSSFHL